LREVDQESLQALIGDLVELATEHTGDPEEGDYLKFQYGSYDGAARTTDVGGSMGVRLTYKFKYYDSANQEEILGAEVRRIIKDLDPEGKSDYEKLKAIHDVICEKVEYDQADGSDSRRTAYDALVNGKAVCQGYSNALYRLLLEAGVDNRIIYGKATESSGVEVAHTWNIVKLDGKYYYVDVTWDDTGGTDDFFVRPRGEFEESHKAGDEYPDDFFTKVCPVSKEEYRTDPEAICALMTGHAQEFAKLFAA
jgi:transglutaminase-like putative cysteine protease